MDEGGEMTICIMGVDPGETTGVALWLGELGWVSEHGVWDALKMGALYSYSCTSEWAKTDRHKHCIATANNIWSLWTEWRASAGSKGMGFWAIERWQPSGAVGSSNTSADQVGWFLVGFREGNRYRAEYSSNIHVAQLDILFQGPSDAMNFATNKRLREAGLWVPGRPHQNDAIRHVATRLAKLDPKQFVDGRGA
jgi:hypothetical protein